MAYGLKFLASLFDVRGHVLEKCLFFRFAEGVRQDCGPNNEAICRTALARDFRRVVAFSILQIPPQAESYSLDHSPADPESCRTAGLRLDPFLESSNLSSNHHAEHVQIPTGSYRICLCFWK